MLTTEWGPVGTRGLVLVLVATRSSGDCVEHKGRTPTRTSTRPPHPLHPAPCPYRTLGRKHLNGYDSPIRSSTFCRRTIYWHTADVSANGPSMRSPGRYIGDVHEVVIRAALRFAEAPTIWPVLVVKVHHQRSTEGRRRF